jgi:hypothetical protein
MSYLSVDLDYWFLHATQRSSMLFFRKLLALNKPIVVVKDHQRLLRDINENWPRDNVLVNIDFHSDISSEIYDILDKRLSCANWADFVHHRFYGHYIWVYPSYEICFERRSGMCDTDNLPFSGEYRNRWRRLSHMSGPNRVNLNTVDRIGVAISPMYCKIKTVQSVLNDLLNIPVSEPCLDYAFAAMARKHSKPTHINASLF